MQSRYRAVVLFAGGGLVLNDNQFLGSISRTLMNCLHPVGPVTRTCLSCGMLVS